MTPKWSKATEAAICPVTSSALIATVLIRPAGRPADHLATRPVDLRCAEREALGGTVLPQPSP